MARDLNRLSKQLSYILRHKPESAGITLTADGWAPISEVLAGVTIDGVKANRQDIDEVIATSEKLRFEISGDMIRASQGHSIAVDLDLDVVEPPAVLFHGTVWRFMDNIRAEGLLSMKRNHVHLSADEETATKVGSRRGKPVILTVAAQQMSSDGHPFYLANNGVWLAQQVPPQYISGPEPEK